jgi:subtilisin-like proprotein convertase family protein
MVVSEERSMNRRVVVLALAGLLTLPVASAMPIAAKSNQKTVHRTFTSQGAISIPGSGTATPYPTTITVKGLKQGKTVDVNVILHGYSENVPDDIDLLLVSPSGQTAVIMSDVGAAQAVNGITLTLDDAAANSLPDSGLLTSGTFRPTNSETGTADMFPAPAPTATGSSALSVFNGSNPNGNWQLFVTDTPGNGPGSIASWSLEITAKVKK